MGIYEVTAKRIRELCKERDITPNRLSYIAGVSQSTVKSILNGESKDPGITTIKKICDGFNITIGEFFNIDGFNTLEQRSDKSSRNVLGAFLYLEMAARSG